MWTRKELKTKGKEAFKRNYWKSVLVALILAFVLGTASAGGGSGGSFGSGAAQRFGIVEEEQKEEESSSEEGSITVEVTQDNGDMIVTTTDNGEVTAEQMPTEAILAFAVTMVVVCVFIIAIAILFDAFILNPIEMGCRKFFFKNLDESAQLSNVVYAFDHNYKNIVKGMFMKDLFITLWSLLFFIPGIIKSYQYRLVAYILADNSEMSYKDALAESKTLMKGNKWRTFVLDLSFIGWELLSILTCGILSIFYVEPYRCSTDAALYETLKYGKAA